MKVDSIVYKADNNDIRGASSNLLDAEKGAISDADLFSDRQSTDSTHMFKIPAHR